jgi:hypothetical protein
MLRLKGLLLPHAAKFGGTSGAPGDFFVAQFRGNFIGHFRRDLDPVEVHLKPTL